MGAPLEDARHLAQRYDRMRQEAEAQVLFISFYFVAVCTLLIISNDWGYVLTIFEVLC